MEIVNYLILTIYSFGYILCLDVNIYIEPKTVRVGEELQVTCAVTDESLDKGISMLLTCPNNGEYGYCIKNCNSLDACTADKCDRKSIKDQPFQCNLKETVKSLTFSYKFILRNSFINNRKQLPFKCSFRGKSITEIVEISTIPLNENTESKFAQIPMTTDKILTEYNKKFNDNEQDGNKNINQSDGNLFKFRSLLIFGLLLGLFISLFLNIWCGAQCCLRKLKFRKLEKMDQEKQCYQTNNELNSQYYCQEYLKRAKSHPNLTNNDFNSSRKLTTSSAYRKPLYRGSIQTFEDVEPHNGSMHSLMNPIYNHQMVLAPIQCIDQSMLPLLYPTSFSPSQNIPTQVDYNKSQSNLDTFAEQEIHRNQGESQFQPLPKKPD